MEKLARKRKTCTEQGNTDSATEEKNAGKQPDENLIGKKRRGKSPYTLESVMQSVALKFYPEQITGYDAEHAEDRKYTEQLIQQLKQRIQKQDATEIQVLMIVHNADFDHDDYWDPSAEKPHVHIIMRFIGKMPNGNIKRERIGTILEMLGVTYRPDVDRTLWEQHGVESIGDFVEYANYLLHWTDKAKRAGKYCYELNDLVSNLSADQVRSILDGHKQISEAAPDENRKVQIETLIHLDQDAYQLGYHMRNFDDWYGNLPFAVRSHQSMKTIQESYYRGITARAEDPTQNGILRLCVFIQGEPDCGKTYAAVHALDALGASVLRIGGGGTGKFDKLKPSHDAIVIDDDVCPNLLNMSDNYLCQAYRRNRNNPYWCGRYLIVTSNLTFTDWLMSCGFRKCISQHWNSETQTMDDVYEHHAALESRFYICRTQPPTGELICEKVSKRGTYEEQLKRKEMFISFKHTYDEVSGRYKKDDRKVYYDDIPDMERPFN